MRGVMLLVAALSGCGRFSFDAVSDPPQDAAADARPDDFVAFRTGCAVGLGLDEAAWTGAAGEVLDACGGHHGSAVAGATPFDDPVRGGVGKFPGPSGCVKIPDAPGLHATTGLTMSAWLYPQVLDAVDPFGVIAKRTDFTNDDAEYTMFVWTDNTVWVDLDSRNDRNHGTRPLVNDRWQQVTVVYDGTQPQAARVKIYVDGTLDAALPETSATLTPYASPLSIGCMPELPGTKPQIAFTGRIDAVGVWTRAFSEPEVVAWYLATRR